MIGIDRYGRHELVVVENEINEHILPPVTTQFVRWVSGFRSGMRLLTLVNSDSTPEHWVPLMHPEGALYWVHERNVSANTHAYYILIRCAASQSILIPTCVIRICGGESRKPSRKSKD